MSFLIALLLFPISSFACKPGPLPKCEQPNQVLVKKNHKNLTAAVEDFQKLLTASIAETDFLFQDKAPPKKEETSPRNSCFNNHFAHFYLNELKDFANKNKNKICGVHPGWVAAQVKDLLDEKSQEWQAIKTDHSKLQELAKKVNQALEDFLAGQKKN